jgi:hypothetical protein
VAIMPPRLDRDSVFEGKGTVRDYMSTPLALFR